MSNRFGILLYRWHAWVGLFSGLFLIVICVTGSIAVFRPEIERAVDLGDFDFVVSTPAPGQEPITIEQAIATAEAKFPGSQATSARFPARGSSTQSHGDFYAISLRPPKQRAVQVLVDPYANRVVHSVDPSKGWGDFVRQLHVRFYYGSFWGRYIVGLFGIALLFSTLSGLFIFTRFNAKRWTPKIRRGKGARIFTADLHKVVGLGSVAFNIVFGITGAVLGFEGVYHKYIAIKERPARHAAVQQIARGDIDRCVEQAKTLIPNGAPVGVGLNYQRSGVIKVDVVHWDTHLIRELSSYVIFKADTLKPVETYDASQANVGVRLYYAMEPLHFGRLGGALWVKLLWGLMGLTGGFLSVTGFVIYILRKRASWRVRASADARAQPAVEPAIATAPTSAL